MVSINYFEVTLFLTLSIRVCTSQSSRRHTNSNFIQRVVDREVVRQLLVDGALDDQLHDVRSYGETNDSPQINRNVVNPTIVSPRIYNQDQDQPITERDVEESCGPKCQSRRNLSKRRWQATLQKHILKALNFTSTPIVKTEDKVSPDSQVVRDILRASNADLEQEQSLFDNIGGETKSKKLVSVAKRPHFPRNDNSSNWFVFNLTAENRKDVRVRNVSINFYIRPKMVSTSSITFQLDRYNRMGQSTYRRSHLKFERKNVQESGVWISFSYSQLINLVDGWIQRPQDNYGVHLSAQNFPDLIATGLHHNEQDFKPFLEIEYEPNSRNRRSLDRVNYCNPAASESYCCIYNFTIDFHALGWDWIIFPRTYQANYCAGECTPVHYKSAYNSLVAAANHQHLSQMAEWKRPKSCCVPKLYAPISLLYYDHQSNIVYSTVPDMQILRCGCA